MYNKLQIKIYTIERKLQHNINKINKCATEDGFKFSETKTKCIHFCNKQNLHKDPKLLIEGKNIPFVEQHKYLGMILNKKLNFILYINYIKKKCNKALQLLSVVAHKNWGGNKETLLKLYRTLIRFKIEYGCLIYQSARKSHMKILNPIYHTHLRLARGAFKTSSVESLYAESYDTPPKLRCYNLALKYYITLKVNPTNPAHNSTFRSKCKTLFQQKEKAIKTFGLRMKSIYQEANISIKKIHETFAFKTPPWNIMSPKTDPSLYQCYKEKTHLLTYQGKFQKIK